MSETADPPIVTDPAILGGKPLLRGTRFSVDFILELLANGASIADILKGYPTIQKDAAVSAIQFAAEIVRAPSATDIEEPGQ
ncbi:MAG: DUF433 domain-containing protein [Bryobacteraceae bacterium]